jgi:FMN phosphatase YigB (HAD superfamily)
MEKTGLPPVAHLMIGDRERVDLVPAKKLGMKTCLVWAAEPSMVADITLPTVYDLSQVLV